MAGRYATGWLLLRPRYASIHDSFIFASHDMVQGSEARAGPSARFSHVFMALRNFENCQRQFLCSRLDSLVVYGLMPSMTLFFSSDSVLFLPFLPPALIAPLLALSSNEATCCQVLKDFRKLCVPLQRGHTRSG